MSNAIALAAFAYLDHGASTPPVCYLQKLSPAVADYLETHVSRLAEKATAETAPPAEFVSRDAKQLFTDLTSRNGKDFERLATKAAQALYGKMDKRAKPGLYVALSRGKVPGPAAAILKLDVVEEHAGTLDHRSGGQVVLEIVEDLVDKPGELQKGAAFPDPRSTSEVIVGEKLGGPASQYFLRGLEIRQMANPRAGAQQLIKTVQKIRPESAGAIASKLEVSKATNVDQFLGEVEELLPADKRQKVTEALTAVPHPVKQIAPAKARITRTLERNGVTIKGSVADMKRVKLESLPGDRWRAQIDFDGKPQERYG